MSPSLVGIDPLRSAAARAPEGSPGFVGSTGAGAGVIVVSAIARAQITVPHSNVETIAVRAMALEGATQNRSIDRTFIFLRRTSLL